MALSECELLNATEEPAEEGQPSWQDHAEADHLFCPFHATLDLLTGRWTLHILQTLMSGPKRFNEIAQINDINPHTLRKRLSDLEEQEVVTRRVISTMPPNVEYGLTEKGYALNGVFQEIAAWGRTYMKPPESLQKTR